MFNPPPSGTPQSTHRPPSLVRPSWQNPAPLQFSESFVRTSYIQCIMQTKFVKLAYPNNVIARDQCFSSLNNMRLQSINL